MKLKGGRALLDIVIDPVFLTRCSWEALILCKPSFVIGDTDVDLFEQILLGWDKWAVNLRGLLH